MILNTVVSITFIFLVGWGCHQFLEKSWCRYKFNLFAFKQASRSLTQKNLPFPTIICTKPALFKRTQNQRKSRWDKATTTLSLQQQMDHQKGNVTFIGILLVLLLSSYLMTIIIQGQKMLQETQNRSFKYLCLKNYLTKTRKYTTKIHQLNLAIIAAKGGSTIPGAYTTTSAIIKALKITQDISHLTYLNQLGSLKYCSKKERLSFFIRGPYQTNNLWKLKRTALETVKSQKKEWKLFFYLSDGSVLFSKVTPSQGKITSITKEIPSWKR